MACTSITALLNTCGNSAGGCLEIYILAYSDSTIPSDAVGTNHYALSTTGLVSEIGLQSGKKFAQIGFYKNTAGLSETLTADVTKGSSYYTQTLTFALQMSNDEKVLVKSLANNPAIVIFKSRSGKYFVGGLSGELILSSNERGTGTEASAGLISTITLSGIDSTMITELDSTILPTLI